MNSGWMTTLTALGACPVADNTCADGLPIGFDFGVPDQELSAAATGTVVSPLANISLIRVAGDDARAFLHNQLTSDINHLAAGSAHYSAWCTAKGRIFASMIVINTGQEYLLRLPCDLVERVAKRLKMFVLRSKVSIEVMDGLYALAGIAGEKSVPALTTAKLPQPEGDMSVLATDNGWVLRLNKQRLDVIVARDALPAKFRDLANNVTPVGSNAWAWREVESGVVEVTAATSEEFVPQMIGLEQRGGVSFHKGCYPGQEIIARTQYLGKVKRHVFRAQGDASLVAGAPVYSAGSPDSSCGTVANVARGPDGVTDALVVVQETYADGPLHVGALGGPLLTVRAPVARA
jgi:folate-binding protein YgfZ